ncbi:hypothetical protein [Pseudoxanthomonas sp. 10H]|uniref:hypothetical protein n=1 Tax=Pseudoxanthomonas sp. 10H TaxID=3242729 RepID=UPI003557C874
MAAVVTVIGSHAQPREARRVMREEDGMADKQEPRRQAGKPAASRRRAYEYDHHYGARLQGREAPPPPPRPTPGPKKNA